MATNKRELRFVKACEFRAETKGDKRYLSGYAATYNVLGDLGYDMQERIIPGAFTRALKEKQDVRCLINHQASLILGRTKSGTTELSADSKGLKFRTVLPATTYANDLYESMSRGDLDECSFAFSINGQGGQRWIEEKRQGVTVSVRELLDVDLHDVSVVTTPFYSNTSAEVNSRAMFPDGVPTEIRSRMKRESTEDDCNCKCPECLDGDCEDCSNDDCEDENCRCSEERMARSRNRLALIEREILWF